MSGKGESYRKLTPDQRKAFEDNFDAIFGKKKKVADEEWDEKRIDVVGSNGNDGLHYDNLTK
jgi:hypothetical protein